MFVLIFCIFYIIKQCWGMYLNINLNVGNELLKNVTLESKWHQRPNSQRCYCLNLWFWLSGKVQCALDVYIDCSPSLVPWWVPKYVLHLVRFIITSKGSFFFWNIKLYWITFTNVYLFSSSLIKFWCTQNIC